ncbi:MAG TPA: phosphate ABC transporter permease PstA [Blastocatellia bacterium]|nr:phosphate ABC transporter permease PstA [Blastocatellia bacterium]
MSAAISVRTPSRQALFTGDLPLSIATGAAVLVIIAMLVVILLEVAKGGAGTVSWAFLSTAPSKGGLAGGIWPAIYGTVFLVLIMTIAAVPVGAATAIYLHEYARADALLTRLVRTAVANLAGVPSIVFGLFGVGFFIETIGSGIDTAFYGGSLFYGKPAIIWAALTLALLTLPVVIVATEEALRAIPREHREGSLALGATRWQTIARVILPQAVPGILTGSILAISRGAGEVAPILFTGAAYYLPFLPAHPTDQFMHLGYHVFVLATQSPDVNAALPNLNATVLVLLVMTFILNITAIIIRARVRARLRG